ncbi:MAG TPA: dienelactone hydrolase family protein [Patescibacteria group bacterium]|nr:dienelactone hydrolase family protein [Patescibacteria group bacterium]
MPVPSPDPVCPRAARRWPALVAGAALIALSTSPAEPATAKLPVQEGEMVGYKVGKDEIKGYLSRPVPQNAYPGVVVIHEEWGLNDQIKGVADRLAAEGYLAIVPDLYRGKVPTDAGYAQTLARGLNDDWAVSAIQGAVTCLRSIDAGERRRSPGQRMPIGTLGFSMGGRLSLVSALKGADIQAMAMFYGRVETDASVLQPIEVPVLGIFGNEDRGVPLDQVKAFEAALKAAGKKATILVYTGVGHAFFNEERPGYDPDISGDAWERTTMFLRDSLGRPAVGAKPISPAPPAPSKPKPDEP